MKKISLVILLGVTILLTGCAAKNTDKIGSVTGQDSLITVNGAAFSLPGYLVAHELTDKQEPGKIIGLSVLYPLGKTNKVLLATTAKLTPGTTYAVVLHHDNSDLKFIASEDLPAKNKKGQVVMAKFTAK